MAKAKIIYKQRHIDGDSGRKFSSSRNAHYALYIGYKPEELKKSSDDRNDDKYLQTREHMERLVKYMGQREHVAKKYINKDVREEENEKLVTYDTEESSELLSEAERKYKRSNIDERDNGLFGYIGGRFSDEYNIKDVQRYIRRMSDSHNVFHSIFSFTPESADEAGLHTLEDWENWVKFHISDIANGMNMKIEDIEYIAAVHLKEGQPHVHIEWWNKKQQIYINKVDPLVCDSIRIAAIKSTYRNEFNAIHNREDELVKELRGMISEQTDKMLTALTPGEYIETIAKGLNHISDILPKKGQLAYKLLKPEIKEEIDKLTHYIIDNNPQLAQVYEKILEQRRLYNELLHATGEDASNWSKYKLAKYMGKLNDDIERGVGNTLLKIIKRERKEGRQRMIDALGAAPIPSEPDGMFHSDRWIDYSEREAFGVEETPVESYIRWSKKFKDARDAAKNKEYDKAFALYSEEAKKGNALAEYEIADLYRRGLIGGEDNSEVHYSVALKGFLKAEKTADTMKPYLQYRIGRMYYDGYGTQQDYAEAFKWLKLSAQGGNHLAEHTVAKMYKDGIGTEKNAGSAVEWFKRAESESTAAAYTLGKMYYEGKEVRTDYREAEKHLLQAAAKDGSDRAELLLGKIYSSNDMIMRNISKAVTWLTRAVEHGNADAAYRLSTIYSDESDAYVHDSDLALIWLNKAIEMYTAKAEEGNHFAALSLGKIYADKNCTAYNVELGEKWLLKAAESETKCAASAEYALGKLYMSDDVMRYGDAVKWLSLSFEHNNNHAAFAMAKIYTDEKTGLVNFPSALEWLEKAKIGAVQSLVENPDSDAVKLTESDLMNWIDAAAETLDLHCRYKSADGKDITEQLMQQIQDSRLPEAEYKIGRIYLSNELLDHRLAEEHLRRSAVLQNPYAMYALAKLYIKGDIPKDHTAAIQLLERVKELDKSLAPLADYTLGAMYMFDEDVHDRELAVKYLTQSAQAGNEYAQALLDNSAAWQERSIMNLIGAVMNMLETNARDGDIDLSEAAAAIFGRGDLSKGAIADLIYKMQDKQNTAEM